MHRMMSAGWALYSIARQFGARLGFAGVLAIASVPLTLMAAPASAAPPATKAVQHCIVQLAPLTAADKAAHRGSKVVSKQCSAQPIVRPDTGDLLITLYDQPGYAGSSVEFTSNPGGCSGDYNVLDFNTIGWNDRTASAVPYCYRSSVLYQDTYLSGATYTISSGTPDLGQFDYTASSWETIPQ